MFKLKIKTDNAAFEPFAGTETARILRKLADKLDDGVIQARRKDGIILRDYNGNVVGEASFT